MSSRTTETFLRDILQSITTIETFLEVETLETYEGSALLRSAVERQLQILTEAAFRLREDAETLCPSVDWRAIRGLGNFLRHEYDAISDRMIWFSVERELPSLKLAVQQALAHFDSRRS